ncbi:MAG: gamma-glutamyltransferase [bacterium]|nr:gamma-glutamyltransferase [bacterium]
MNRKITIVLLLSCFIYSCSVLGIKPAEGEFGMVSSAAPLATKAGLKVLESGGNAFDAAVAVASVLNVVEPMMSGMGGYGTILVYDAEKNEVRFLDSSGKIPANVNSDAFREPTPDFKENRKGPKAVSTPGNVNAWYALSSEYGNLEWKGLFDSAIEISENGFRLQSRIAYFINRAFDKFPDHAKEFYGSNGEPLKNGDLLVQKDLARSFRIIAEVGPEAYYGGDIGQAIHDEMQSTGGFLALEDLVNDRAEWWEPILINYRGFKVYTASPPSTAFPSLIRLGLMSRFETDNIEHNSVEYLHRFAEATKYAFWCRLSYAGDPEINPPPLSKLLSVAYLDSVTSAMSMDKATHFEYPQVIVAPNQNTTHFVVADKWGNIVSATQTLGNSFGSRIMPKGTGIWLNNSLSYCTFEPKGNPMDAHAGHRKLSGDCPTIIMKDGRPWVAIGTPGGHTIGQTVPQMVMNLIDFNMNIQDAIAAPRISFIEPDSLAFESEIDESVIEKLTDMGHGIFKVRGLGNAHGLMIEYDNTGNPVRFYGASDPRSSGLARGVKKK